MIPLRPNSPTPARARRMSPASAAIAPVDDAHSGGADVSRPSAEDLDAFAAAYTVLSRLLLAAPAQDVLDSTRAPDMLAEWPMPATEITARGRDLLADSGRAGEDERAVRRDYNRLFVGPDKLLAPPYESVQRSPDQLLFEEETVRVRAFYARFGLVAPRLEREPDDHIGLELAFMATLSTRALDSFEWGDADALSELVSAQREFLEAHLLAWGPDLMVLIGRHADTAFYRGVSALGFGTLEHAALRLCGRALST